MVALLKNLQDKGLIQLPSWLHVENVQYLSICGSHAYGCADTSVKDKIPDYDVYGFAIPSKDRLFPGFGGHVLGFGQWANPTKKLTDGDPWHQTHIFDKDGNGGHGKEWDFTIFGIVRYFELLRGCNPNLADTLFTPENCIIHITSVGRLLRDNRKKFLGKIAWKTFRGYALDQLKKADNKITQKEMVNVLTFEKDHEIPHATTYADLTDRAGVTPELMKLSQDELAEYKKLFLIGLDKNSRFEDNKKFQMDRKFLYNIVRLYDEAEQIIEGNGEVDINLQRSKEAMKAVRRGEWSSQQIHDFVAAKDVSMEAAYNRCTLPEFPDEKQLRKLLVECLEIHYGSIEKFHQEPDWSIEALREIDQLLDKHRMKIHN